jgi:hypothetical protein
MEQKTTAMPVIAGIFILISEGMKLLAVLGFTLFVIIAPRSAVVVGFIGLIYLALLVIAVLGGVAALQRRNYGLALAGAIISALPFSFLGIAAIVLVALSRREFPSSSR